MSSEVSQTLGPIVTLLGAAVIAVPLFRKLGLGSVLAYFAAGLLVGPSGVAWFTDPQAILHVSELGVVMFLFIIGLEMRPQRLWSMRRDIFGLGLAQVLMCTALLFGLGALLGLLVILIRLAFSFKISLMSFNRMKAGDFLPWILLSFALITIPQGHWAQPTALGFSTLIGGLVLAALNHKTVLTDAKMEQTPDTKTQ